MNSRAVFINTAQDMILIKFKYGVVRFLVFLYFVCLSNAFLTERVDEIDRKISSVIDQSQSGDYNVHVSLKDVKIIALLGGKGDAYSDYDYNYDYSELTIKPQNTTSTTPIYITNESTGNSTSPTTTSPNTANLTTDTTTSQDTTSANTSLNTTTTGSLATTRDTLKRSNDTTRIETDVTTEMVVEITPAKREGIQSTTPFPVSNNVVIITENSQSLENGSVTTVTSTLEESTSAHEQTTKNQEMNKTVAEPTHGGIVCQRGYMRNKKGECELRVKPSQGNTLRKLVELSQRLKLRKIR